MSHKALLHSSPVSLQFSVIANSQGNGLGSMVGASIRQHLVVRPQAINGNIVVSCTKFLQRPHLCTVQCACYILLRSGAVRLGVKQGSEDMA
jgi:hypothetical protein